jgi:hypothetical protein
MKQANLYNYDVEAEDLARRQQVADALREQSMQAPQTGSVGGMQGNTHWSSVAANMLAGYGAKKGAQQVKQGKQELAERYQKDMADGMRDYHQKAQGYTVPPLISKPNMVDGVQQGAVTPGNPKAAIAEAMASGHPAIQKFGMDEYARTQANQLKPSDLAERATNESVLANPNNSGAWEASQPLTSTTPGQVSINQAGRAVNPEAPMDAEGGEASLGPLPIGATAVDSGPGWETYTDARGTLYQRSSAGTKKIDTANSVTVNNNEKGPESEFLKTLGREMGTSVMGIFDRAKKSGENSRLVDNLQRLNNSDTYSGPTANLALGISAFAQTLGLDVDEEKLGNSEEYKRALSAQVSTYLTAGAGVGRSLTDADRKVLEQQFPTLVNTVDGRNRIIEQMKMDIAWDIQKGEETRQQLSVDYPELAGMWNSIPNGVLNDQGSSDGIMTWDEYMATQGAQ